MISGREVIWHTRLLAGDAQKTKFSDYEIYEAINTAVDMLCEGLRKYFSPELLRRCELTLSNGSCDLPEGFLYLSELSSNGRIEGDRLICGSRDESVAMVYGKHPGKIEKDEDNLDLAEGFSSPIASCAAYLLKGEVNAAAEKTTNAAYEKTADKRGPVPDPRMWTA